MSLTTLYGKFAPMDADTVTVEGTAVPLTAARLLAPTTGDIEKGFGAVAALICVKTAAVVWRCDGGDPTAAVGNDAAVGDVIYLEGSILLTQFRAIRLVGSGALFVTYFYQKRP
jgi:hypothetical protein